MSHHTNLSKADRHAPIIAGLIVTALLAVLVLLVARELVTAIHPVISALGGAA